MRVHEIEYGGESVCKYKILSICFLIYFLFDIAKKFKSSLSVLILLNRTFDTCGLARSDFV